MSGDNSSNTAARDGIALLQVFQSGEFVLLFTQYSIHPSRKLFKTEAAAKSRLRVSAFCRPYGAFIPGSAQNHFQVFFEIPHAVVFLVQFS